MFSGIFCYPEDSIGATGMLGGDLDIHPPSVLKYNPGTIWYTDSCHPTHRHKESDTFGAGLQPVLPSQVKFGNGERTSCASLFQLAPTPGTLPSPCPISLLRAVMERSHQTRTS